MGYYPTLLRARYDCHGNSNSDYLMLTTIHTGDGLLSYTTHCYCHGNSNYDYLMLTTMHTGDGLLSYTTQS